MLGIVFSLPFSLVEKREVHKVYLCVCNFEKKRKEKKRKEKQRKKLNHPFVRGSPPNNATPCS